MTDQPTIDKAMLELLYKQEVARVKQERASVHNRQGCGFILCFIGFLGLASYPILLWLLPIGGIILLSGLLMRYPKMPKRPK